MPSSLLFLTGPAGSGKTTHCLNQLRERLRAGRFDGRFLTPTTTMAEHLRNELAREGFVFPPGVVSTFGKFVADFVRDIPPVSAPGLELLVRDVLGTLPLTRYEPVRDFPGFRSALVRAIEELAGAGGSDEDAALADEDFLKVWKAVHQELARRGEHFRASRLRIAADRIRSGEPMGPIWVVGFFGFTPAEAEVLAALGDNAESVTVAQASPNEPAQRPAAQHRILVTAPTAADEANEIARRIVEQRAAGRAFREMGVIVRSEQPAVPALQAAFARYGIPSRSYFSPPLRTDATVRYLLALVDAAFGGWDHEETLAALRMHGSPLERMGDRFEFEMLSRIPGSGLDGLRAYAPESVHWFFDALSALTPWALEAVPASTWAKRFQGLPALFRAPRPEDGASDEQVLLWKRQFAALEHFSAAALETAHVLGGAERVVTAAEFREALDVALRSSSLRIVDRRRDVVHLIDAVEARQWRLPVVFLCGLLEDQFPKRHSEDPILSDALRDRLKRRGLGIKTSADRQRDEEFLFELALTRATDLLCLSYPQLNARGEPHLPSFFLKRAEPFDETKEFIPAKPAPTRQRAAEPFAILNREPLIEWLGERVSTLSPSRVETFLDCPYRFFTARTLRLQERPGKPWERLSPLVQGNIAHAVLERVFRDGSPLEPTFEEAFRTECAKNNVPDGYRTETIRLELLHGVRKLATDATIAYVRNEPAEYEKEFEYALSDSLRIRGKIDRLVKLPDRRALILDYKYKRKYKVDETWRENKAGRRVQTGLYLMAAQRHLKLHPVGMVYAGFKLEVSYRGWALPGVWPGDACSQTEIDEVITTAHTVTLEAHEAMRQGRIEPDPADRKNCEYCSAAAMCRIETITKEKTVNAAQ